MNDLYHYGIPRRSGRYPYGSGKNPYQSDPVKRRSAKEYQYVSKTNRDVQKIVDTLSISEKRLLGMTDKQYLDQNEVQYIAKRFIKKVKNVPVAFLDVYYQGEGRGSIAVATSKNARGRGYAQNLVNRAEKWMHSTDAKDVLGMKLLVWEASANNKASIVLAKKNQFKEMTSDKTQWTGQYKI